jgi:CubicO group peptidase (beta-lactamase class C family)
VVRTPASPVDDVVPAARPITVIDLLDFRAGYGFPDDFSLPAVELLLNDVQMFGRDPALVPAPDEWMAVLSRVPLLHQPGDAWLYNTCSDIQGVLIARVSGRTLPEFLADRLFEPLGMVDTGFAVPADKLDRFTSYYQIDPAGGLQLAEAPDGESSRPPVFPSGAGGLVGTVDDWHAFARMLLAEGLVDGRPLMSPDSVRKMRTDQITQSQRDASRLFLEGQGWGFGGSVDVADIDPWNVQGRYGWVGGTGTTAHITPSTDTTTILLSQVAMTGPTPTALMRDFWRSAVAGPEV